MSPGPATLQLHGWGSHLSISPAWSAQHSRLTVATGLLLLLPPSVWRLFLSFSQGCLCHVVGSCLTFILSPFLTPLFETGSHPPTICVPILCFIGFTAPTTFQHATYLISCCQGSGFHPTRGGTYPVSVPLCLQLCLGSDCTCVQWC